MAIDLVTTNGKVVKGSLRDIAKRDNISLAESFLAVDIIILVDVSGSMDERDAPGGLSRLEAAGRELARLQNELPGRIAVVCFGSQVQFSPSGTLLPDGGGTAMHRALQFVQPADDSDCQFFLISDGEPNMPDETLLIASRFNSTINTVYIGPENGEGRKFLKELAAKAGGQMAASKAPGLLNEPVKLMLGG